VDIGNSLKTASDKFEREAPTMSESQRTTRQRQLVDQDRDFQRKRREFQEDLNARKNEELQQVLERANKVVKQVAEAEKYDVILQEAVYINPKHDITDKVIKALNGQIVGRSRWWRELATGAHRRCAEARWRAVRRTPIHRIAPLESAGPVTQPEQPRYQLAASQAACVVAPAMRDAAWRVAPASWRQPLCCISHASPSGGSAAHACA
jgi:uncharacterized FlaG/YvyC family protein